MFTKTFFKLFPPPKFLNIPYAGLDISDDAIHAIEYAHGTHGYSIHRFGMRPLAPGVVESGYIRDEKALTEAVSSLAKELKLTTIKASLPEERMYLFKTEVPTADETQARQNIEFKLEENVPLKPADASFFFDFLSQKEGKNMASVSVAPRGLIDRYLKVFQDSGLSVISFEIQAKAIARAVVPRDSLDTVMLVHVMDQKTGLYVVSNGIVCFTSTISWKGTSVRGKNPNDISDEIFSLRKEIERVSKYWKEYGEGQPITSIIVSGKDAVLISQISHISPDAGIPLKTADTWQNVFSGDHYIAPIPFEESLDYTVAAGLALP
ncbi:MAG: pilus assembly protein PilM [Patescibacteria group bacterium]